MHVDGSSKPTGRSGHTMVVINNKIVMFGGILEITKETDEVFIYDFASNRWFTYESPILYNGGNSPMMLREGDDLHDDKSIFGGNSNKMTLKKNKNTSSMPNFNNSLLPDLKNSSSKFAPNMNSNYSSMNINNQAA